MGKIPIKTPEEVSRIRKACQVTVQILDAVGEIVKPGISTDDINSFVHRMTLELGAAPATLNYKGYPKSVCTSINDVVCHGVPSPYVQLLPGDIINIDVTSIYDGCFGDASRMFLVGGPDSCKPEAVELVQVTKEALLCGVNEVGPGKHFGDIGAAIKDFIKSIGRGYGIVREYTGHGVGLEFHEPPQVLHVGRYGSCEEMLPGMTFTIEPMINLGGHKTVLSKIDGWTVRTADGSLSAQWEHTVLVTDDGVEILSADQG